VLDTAVQKLVCAGERRGHGGSVCYCHFKKLVGCTRITCVCYRLLRLYLPLVKLEVTPQPLLGPFIDLSHIIGHYTSKYDNRPRVFYFNVEACDTSSTQTRVFSVVLEEHVKTSCDKVLQHHTRQQKQCTRWLWPILDPPKWRSTVPEDMIFWLNQYIKVLTEGNTLTPLHNSPGTRTHTYAHRRAKEFRTTVLYSLCSALVWTKDTISRSLHAQRWTDGPARERDEGALFLCALCNDCWRFTTEHVCSLENDFRVWGDDVATQTSHVKDAFGALASDAVSILVEVILADENTHKLVEYMKVRIALAKRLHSATVYYLYVHICMHILRYFYVCCVCVCVITNVWT
jgi:hypothetical protein